MNPLDYLHLQLRLEGKQVVEGDRLRQVEVVPGEEMPLMVIAQLADKQVVAYYDESLSPGLQRKLANRVSKLVFPAIEPLLAVFKSSGSAVDLGHYKTYVFPGNVVHTNDDAVRCLSKHHSAVRAFGFGDFAEHVFVIERDGKVVSACVSTRENAQCGEAWVYTDERYRRQGFAQQVVQAWAAAMTRRAKLPFYSHQMENIASANLARHLKLAPAFEEIAVFFTQAE